MLDVFLEQVRNFKVSAILKMFFVLFGQAIKWVNFFCVSLFDLTRCVKPYTWRYSRCTYLHTVTQHTKHFPTLSDLHAEDREWGRERTTQSLIPSLPFLPTLSFIIYLLSAVFPSHAYWCRESRVWVRVRIISWRGRQGGSNQQSADAIWQPLEPLVHS